MRSPVIGCLLAAAMVVISAGPRVGWGAPVEAKVADQIGRLRDSAQALKSAGFSSHAGKLAKAVDEIAQWAAGHEALTTGQIDKLKAVHKRLTSAARMWAGADRQDKVDALREHAAVVQGAIAAMEPLARDVPVAAGSVATLTVSVRPGGPPASQGQTRREPTQQQRRPNSPYGGAPGAGMGGPGAGMGFGAAGQPTHSAYGTVQRTPQRARTPAAAAQAEGLTIILREPNKTFYDVRTLRNYLNGQKAELATATVVFHFDGTLRWSDVQQVINTFGAAPLHGPMQIADLKLRSSAPAPAGIATTPPGPMPAGMAAAPAAAAPTPAAPAPAPAVSGDLSSLFGAGLDPVLADKTKVLFAVDVTSGTLPAVASALAGRVKQMAPTVSVAVVAVNAQGAPVKVFDWAPAGPVGGAQLDSALRAATAPTGRGSFQALVSGATAEFATCEAVIFVAEGAYLQDDQPVLLDAVYRLAGTRMPTGMVILGRPGNDMRSVIERIGNVPGNAAVIGGP